MPTNSRRARECHQANLILLDQVIGNFGGLAENEVEHAWRESRVMKCSGYVQRAGRRFFGGFYND